MHQLEAVCFRACRSLACSKRGALWQNSSTVLIILFSFVFPVFATSNMATGAVAAVVSFGIVTAFAGIHEATRSHDTAFTSSRSLSPAIAFAQQQHFLNRQLLTIAHASFPGQNAYVDSACGTSLETEAQHTPFVSPVPSARSEATICDSEGSYRSLGRSVVVPMHVPRLPMTGNVSTGAHSAWAQDAQPHTHSQCLSPASGSFASATSLTTRTASGSSSASVGSVGKQLSTRIAGLPPQAPASHTAGLSRASSYATTLGGLESLPSHFSPDADSDDDSAGCQRAALAALLAKDPGTLIPM